MKSELEFDIKDLFGEKLLKQTEEIETNKALEDVDYIGIYFSAHWCPPCRGFTPKLVEAYKTLKDAGKKFEIVFASSDSTQDEFESYYKDMSFLALPFSEREKKEKLGYKYGCKGIPFLVILDAKNGEVITKDGRGNISGKNFVEEFPYHPKPLYDISESMDGIYDGKVLFLIQNYADEETQKKNNEIFLKFATDNKKLFIKYFTVNGGGADSFVRSEFDLPSSLTHKCPLEKQPDTSTAYLEMMGSKEAAKNWSCDNCRKVGSEAQEQHHCKECQFDLCEECIQKLNLPIKDEEKIPVFLCGDIGKGVYYKPLDATISEHNIKVFASDIEKGEVKAITLKSER
jgi:thiol-disulfide isomerase/thioredoxin